MEEDPCEGVCGVGEKISVAQKKLWRQTQLDESCLECGQAGFRLLTETQLEHPRLPDVAFQPIPDVPLTDRRPAGPQGRVNLRGAGAGLVAMRPQ